MILDSNNKIHVIKCCVGITLSSVIVNTLHIFYNERGNLVVMFRSMKILSSKVILMNHFIAICANAGYSDCCFAADTATLVLYPV